MDEFRHFVQSQLLDNGSIRGLEQAFADVLQTNITVFSRHKSGELPIGDQLARRYEIALKKPSGWLSEKHEATWMSEAEQAQVLLALNVYRNASSRQKRELRELVSAALSAVRSQE